MTPIALTTAGSRTNLVTAGLGTDLVEVDRIADKIGKEQGFRELVFSPGEIAYCESRTHKFEHYAARFAAKEAFFKALGTGWINGTAFNEVEIIHDAKGQPGLKLNGETARTLEATGIRRILVSLTHIKSMASAVVIIETEPRTL
jgi:holo-[acyl-carrier protein] synthase